jgi:CubicO group peptidase (beta-lactamase class C family)
MLWDRLETSSFRGAVALCSDANDVIVRTFGYTDGSSRERVNTSTLFDLCSVTKTFTAAAVRALCDGRYSIANRRLGEFVDGFPDEIASIRVDQLLMHSSGLPDFIDRDGRPCEYSLENDYRPLSRNEFLAAVRRTSLLFPPGQRWSYSNTGYSLLAAVVELVTGEAFDEFLRSRVLVPLGMKNTRYHASSDQDVATGRLDDGRDWRQPIQKVAGTSWNLIGNGGLLSTISDLIRWREAFCSPPWPGIEDRSADHRAIVDQQRSIWSGGGRFFHEMDSESGTVIYHNGSNSVFSATIRWLPRHDRYLAVLSASAAIPAMSIARTLCELGNRAQ